MPSSKDRRRIEVPSHFHEKLAEIAEKEDRTITSVLQELLWSGLVNYRPTWVPSDHLDRFTQAARYVLGFAKAEAYGFNHHYIGTEHLLLGLLREGEGVAARVLAQLGVDLNRARAAVDLKIGRGDHPAIDEIDYVPRVRKVLALAVDEAQGLGHDYIGTEHLLLGLVREGEGIAAGILRDFGAFDKVREQTLALLG
jgi:ATP-dependent Clp protease ATP-binding subunit ClpA